MEGQETLNEISIVRSENQLKEFQVKKQRVLDDVLQNVQKRFDYLENDPVLKAAPILDPDIWPTDPMKLSSYGNEEMQVLADYYKDHLLRAGCELSLIEREWSSVKSHVSLHLSGRRAEEVFVSIFRSQADQCHNFLLLAEIVLIWPLSTAVVERGFSSMNRVKTVLRSSMSQQNLDGVLRVSIKDHPIPKAQRPQAFVNSGLLSKANEKRFHNAIESRKEHIKNLSNTHLTDEQITLLSRGLKFIPVPVMKENLIRRQLLADFNQFARRMRLQYIFYGEEKEPHSFHVKSDWDPPVQRYVALETFLEEVKFELATTNIVKPKDNISPGERCALKELLRDKNIIM